MNARPSRKRIANRLKVKLGMRKYHRDHPHAARDNGRRAILATQRLVDENFGGDWTAWGLSMTLARVQRSRRNRA